MREIVDDKKHVCSGWENRSNSFRQYTNQNDLYWMHLNRIIPKDFNGTVLEIGPGDGSFAKMVKKNFSVDYTVLDLEQNIFDSVNTLRNSGYDVEYVLSQDYEVLFDFKFDLIVSNVCLPETPKYYRENLMNNLIPKCQYSMIIGQLRGKWVEGDEYEKWILDLFHSNFSKVICEKTDYKNCYALLGKK